MSIYQVSVYRTNGPLVYIYMTQMHIGKVVNNQRIDCSRAESTYSIGLFTLKILYKNEW